MLTFEHSVKPTEPGQSVRLIGYGGNVAAWHADLALTGTVVRFTRAGNPVVRFAGGQVASHTGKDAIEVTDTLGCARVVDPATGRLLRPDGYDS